jgi:heat shock protein HtpX
MESRRKCATVADYYSLLANAIDRLPHSTPDTRRQLYERARRVLLTHLQNAQPALAAADMERQLAAFDSAVAEIEVEFAIGAALKTSPPTPDTASPEARDGTTSAAPSVSPPQRIQDRSAEKPDAADIRATGLRAHIRNNSLQSIFLIVGFPFVLPFVVFCVVLGPLVFFGSLQAFHAARVASIIALVVTLGMTLVWLPIAYFINQWIIDRATGARLLTRSDDVSVWNLLQKLCTQCGMRMPTLRVIETDELNAYASGLSEATFSVTVTEGLMATLNDAELEAVLAHELTHILNRDVRLTVVVAILVGVVPIMETIFVRGFWYLMNGFSKLYEAIFTMLPVPGAVLMIKLAYGLCFVAGKCFAILVGAIGHFCTLLLNFSLSRRREFMADAGTVAITSDPDAMISALRKISGHSDVPATLANVRELFFDNPRLTGFEGFFATHPTIQARIDALLPYARAASNGETVEFLPAGGRWGDRAGDFIGTTLLVCAIGTMAFLILAA